MLPTLTTLNDPLMAVSHLVAAHGRGGPIPNPGPATIPGLTGPVNTIISWAKWAVLICGMIGLLICAGKMTIGHRNRATFAADGATSIPWVLGGLSLALIAADVVSAFVR